MLKVLATVYSVVFYLMDVFSPLDYYSTTVVVMSIL